MQETARATGFGTVDISATDHSGQKRFDVRSIPGATTIAELVRSLRTTLGLVEHDAKGNQIAYRARLDREGRHLHGAERVGDAVKPGDTIALSPKVNAG